MGVPFYLQPHIPGSAVLTSHSNYRDSLVHFMKNDSEPFALHQLKSKNPEAFRQVFRLKRNTKNINSVCSMHTHVVNSSSYEMLTPLNSNYDPDRVVSMVSKIYNEAASYFSANQTHRYF